VTTVVYAFSNYGAVSSGSIGNEVTSEVNHGNLEMSDFGGVGLASFSTGSTTAPFTGPGYYGFRLPTHPRHNGVMYLNSMVTLDTIRDGTSTTAAVGERYRRPEIHNGFPFYVSKKLDDNSRYGYHAIAGVGGGTAGNPATHITAKHSIDTAFAKALGSTGVPFNFEIPQRVLPLSSTDNNQLTTVCDLSLAPTVSGVFAPPLTGDPLCQKSFAGFSSRHTGGVNMLFLDGSVRYLGNNTSGGVRLAIGTRAGGEPVSNFE
jgi:prepilin-type processing-associated H-X9-DG protein